MLAFPLTVSILNFVLSDVTPSPTFQPHNLSMHGFFVDLPEGDRRLIKIVNEDLISHFPTSKHTEDVKDEVIFFLYY